MIKVRRANAPGWSAESTPPNARATEGSRDFLSVEEDSAGSVSSTLATVALLRGLVVQGHFNQQSPKKPLSARFALYTKSALNSGSKN